MHARLRLFARRKGLPRCDPRRWLSIVLLAAIGCGEPPEPHFNLTVGVSPGVIATPGEGTTDHPAGASVSYQVGLRPGYENLHAYLEGTEVPTQGSVTLDRDKTLWAVADSVVTASAAEQALVQQLVALISGPSPVTSYQALQTGFGELAASLGPTEALRHLRLAIALAYDPVRDAAALTRALATIHGAAAVSVRRIQQTVRSSAATTSPGSEVTFVYVNGINTLADDATITEQYFINPAVTAAGYTDRGLFPVTHVLNHTAAETPAAQVWVCLELKAIQQDVGWFSRAVGIASCFAPLGAISGTIPGTDIPNGDLSELFAEVLNILFLKDSPALAQPDALTLAALLQDVLGSGGRAVLVAHSQGNLIATEALGVLQQSSTPVPLQCLGIVSIAPPYPVALAPGQEHVSGVIIKGTRSVDPLLLLPKLGYGLGADPVTNELSDTYDHLRFLTSVLASLGLPIETAVNLHQINRSYLGENRTRDAIVARIHHQATGVLDRCPITGGSPSIVFAPASVSFTATQGGTSPPPQGVHVSNGGGGSLTGLALGPITYTAGQPTGWLSASLIGTTAPATLTLQASTGALAGGTTYTATVPVTSSIVGVSPQNVTVTFAVAGATAAPSALTATAVSVSQINLAWTDNANNEDGFRIERAPRGTTTFDEIATVPTNVTTYQNGGLAAGTTYKYRVRAYNVAGPSAYSNTAQATTGTPPIVDVTGTWIGTVTVSIQPGTIGATLALVQTGVNVSGTYTADNGRFGSISASISGTSFTSTLTFEDACGGTATSSGDITQNGTHLSLTSTVNDCLGFTYNSTDEYDKQ